MGVCESFISVKDLILCGLSEDMLDKHGHEASFERDKICLSSSGEWKFLQEEKIRGGGNSASKVEITLDDDKDDKPTIKKKGAGQLNKKKRYQQERSKEKPYSCAESAILILD